MSSDRNRKRDGAAVISGPLIDIGGIWWGVFVMEGLRFVCRMRLRPPAAGSEHGDAKRLEGDCVKFSYSYFKDDGNGVGRDSYILGRIYFISLSIDPIKIILRDMYAWISNRDESHFVATISHNRPLPALISQPSEGQ